VIIKQATCCQQWSSELQSLNAPPLISLPCKAALPYELHKMTFDTVGPSTLGGALVDDANTPLVGHYRVVPPAGAPEGSHETSPRNLVVMGVSQSLGDCVVTFRELDEAGSLVAVQKYR